MLMEEIQEGAAEELAEAVREVAEAEAEAEAVAMALEMGRMLLAEPVEENEADWQEDIGEEAEAEVTQVVYMVVLRFNLRLRLEDDKYSFVPVVLLVTILRYRWFWWYEQYAMVLVSTDSLGPDMVPVSHGNSGKIMGITKFTEWHKQSRGNGGQITGITKFTDLCKHYHGNGGMLTTHTIDTDLFKLLVVMVVHQQLI
ncbi:hypothetical protein B0H10DRAFT_1953572 [Mycena sp. CBHHK59/15]|nr:hypothetical protein B0H10DRAFT_1953572 [Mycena sp. CBHHK59/15]